MSTAKQAILEAVGSLSEELTEDEIVEELRLRLLVQRRLAAVERGEVISHDDVEKRMARWLDDSSGQ